LYGSIFSSPQVVGGGCMAQSLVFYVGFFCHFSMAI
jgi:hypothetical protein